MKIKIFLFLLMIPILASTQECIFENLDSGNLREHIIASESRCSDQCLDVCQYSEFYQIPVAFHVINSEIEDQIWPTESDCEFFMDQASELFGYKFIFVRADQYYPCVSFYNNPDEEFTTLVAETTANNNEEEVYSTSRYDPTKILNIYYVRYINGPLSGVKGGTRSPFSSNWTLETDGIFLSKNVNGGGETIAHEFGHYLGLLHVWGNIEYSNSNCHIPISNCTSGDLVPDTPPCGGPWPWGAGENNCMVDPSLWVSFSGSTSNPFCSSDMIHPCDNIMAYGGGRDVITPGQLNRMRFTINTLRAELFPENLNFKVASTTPYTASLEWNRSVNSEGYEIRYKKVTNNQWTTVIIDDEITESYLLENLEAGFEYIVEIKISCETDYTQVIFSTQCDPTVLCDLCLPSEDEIITSTMIFDQTQVSGDLIISGGVTLTINQKVEFRENSRIIVKPGAKLIIDANGVLTKCPGADHWQGIIIDGRFNSPPGIAGGEVDIRNGGTIECALIGVKKINRIVVSNSGGLITNVYTSVGKLTMSTSATIRNCVVGVELNSTGGSTFGYSALESSTIDYSLFEQNDIGIRLKGNRGLVLKENTFLSLSSNTNIINVGDFGVEIINSFVDIIDNTFVGFDSAILINASHPNLMGSNIRGNSFLGDAGGFSIYNESLNNAEYLNIQGNTMIDYDINNIGLSTFFIANNDLLFGYHAITSSATGAYINNIVQDNNFSNNEIGNNVDGINDIEYLTNCFVGTLRADIGLGYGTTINPEQGDAQFSAGNCFQHGSRIQTAESSNPNTEFKYFTKDGFNSSPNNCKDPGSGNFIMEDADNESENSNCGSGAPVFGELPWTYRDCERFYNQNGDLSDFIMRLEDEIAYLQLLVINGQLNNWVANKLIAKYRSCLDNALKTKVIDILEHSDDTDREEAITFLTARVDFRYQIMAYGIMVDRDEYSRARAYLNDLNPDRDDEVDFIAVQHIYLDHLEARDTYVLSPSDRDMIYDVGEKRMPLSGFARTVYYTLTGDRHFITVPAYNDTPHNRVVKEDVQKKSVRIYPNPGQVDETLQIYINGEKDDHSQYHLEIYNSRGELLLEEMLSEGKNAVNIDNRHKGLLFVRIKNGGKIFYTDKLIRM